MLIRLASACALALLGLHALAQAPQTTQRHPSEGPAAFQWDARVQRGQLPNGLNYYLVPGVAPKGALNIQLLVKTGSLDETDQQSGVAHMVEHTVFHASDDFPQGLHAQIKALGWRVSEQVNAMTNFERTLFMLQLSGQHHGQWDEGLHLLAQIAGGAHIPAATLEGERKIILEEWRGKLGINERMERQRRALLRAGSLYPMRATIGTEASIRSQSASALQQFYATWYHPNNMALLVVGDFDAQAMQARIAHWFGPQAAQPLPAHASREPELSPGLRIARLQDPESGSSQVAWFYRFVGNGAQDANGLRDRLLDQMTNELLTQRIRQLKDSLPPQVESLVSAKGQIGGQAYTLALSARVTVDGHAQGLQALAQTLERLRREGFADSDFERQRIQYLKTNAGALTTAAQRDSAQWTQLLNEAATQNLVLQAPSQRQAMTRQILTQMTLQDVQARLRRWLNSPDQLIFMIAPGNAPLTLPTQQEVQNLQQQVARQPLPTLATPAIDNAAPPPLPDSEETGQIVHASRQGQVLHWQLSNGDQVVWLQRPNQDGSLQFSAQSNAGYQVAGQPSWQRQMALQLGAQSAPAGWTHAQFATWLRQQPWTLNADQSSTKLRWNARPPASQLALLLHLYWLRQRTMQIRPEAVTESTQALQRQTARGVSSSRDQAAQTLAELRGQTSPDDALPGAHSLDALSVDTIQALWEQHTQAPTTYFLAGAADEAEVRRLVERYLAVLPRNPQLQPATALPLRPGQHQTELHIGLEPQAAVQANGATAFAWNPQAAMEVNVLSQALYRALRYELREKENGIYRLRFNLKLNPASQMLETEIAFTADPQRMSVLWQKVQAILAAPARYIDPTQLPDIITSLTQAERQRLTDDAAWFSRLQLSWQQYGDARYLDQIPSLAQQLQAPHVLALAQQLDLTRDLVAVLTYPQPAP
jgi:zinc protease